MTAAHPIPPPPPEGGSYAYDPASGTWTLIERTGWLPTPADPAPDVAASTEAAPTETAPAEPASTRRRRGSED